jgi:hypothetical protein
MIPIKKASGKKRTRIHCHSTRIVAEVKSTLKGLVNLIRTLKFVLIVT